MRKFYLAASIMLLAFPFTSPALATANHDLEELKAEIHNMKQSYENRISELESKLKKLETAKAAPSGLAPAAPGDPSDRKVYGNEFNPSISVILNGKYSGLSADSLELAGFGVGEEGERGREGLALDESELTFSASIDDKFYGSLTAAIVREGGEDKVELEEAYVQTLA
ncbi:MAG TPA: hypothetical protein DEQ20_02370 [Desulfobulbaceae bacterium]|nr:hypothetical protein [Desulfobulbaceae bacterium]